MGRKKADDGVTLIAPNTEISGDIAFADQLYVNGKVVGNLRSHVDQASVVIAEDGCVEGEIRVPNVVINGRVDGDVYASGRLELAKNAQVKGNVFYQLIEMQLGAMVDGQLVHKDFTEASNQQAEAVVTPLKAEESAS